MKESYLQSKVKKAIEQKYGDRVVVYNIHGSNFQEAGIPDLLVCASGKFLGLEIKTGGDYGATAIQLYQIDRIKRAGGAAEVVTSVEQSLKLVDEFMN